MTFLLTPVEMKRKSSFSLSLRYKDQPKFFNILFFVSLLTTNKDRSSRILFYTHVEFNHHEPILKDIFD